MFESEHYLVRMRRCPDENEYPFEDDAAILALIPNALQKLREEAPKAIDKPLKSLKSNMECLHFLFTSGTKEEVDILLCYNLALIQEALNKGYTNQEILQAIS